MLPVIALLALAVSVSTGNYDIARTNSNTNETTLTQAKVATQFGKLGTFVCDAGFVYAQPLVIDGVSIGGASRLLIVATMHDTICAFNADLPGSAPIWSNSLGTPTVVDGTSSGLLTDEMGCLSTPVVDTSASVVYAACSVSGAFKLFSFNLDGSTFHSPVTFSATVSSVNFAALPLLQRPPLLLLGGVIYVGFGSNADNGTWYGWIMSYNSTTLTQVNVWCSDCAASGNGGAVWNGGLCSDGTNIYTITGNGNWNGTSNFGESFVKLSSALSEMDYFTPADYATLNAGDLDLGSGRCLVLGSFVMGGGKDGIWWLLNQSALGSLQGAGGSPPIAQDWQTLRGQMINAVAFANNTLFLQGSNVPGAGGDGKLASYSWGGSTFNTTPKYLVGPYHNRGCGLAYSSNGSTAGTDIIWCLAPDAEAYENVVTGTLHALNASTGQEIWASGATKDALGNYAKFGIPTIANGKVFAPTFSGQVTVFGLIPGSQLSGGVSVSGSVILQ